jgi:hypothetical protein
MFGPFLAQYKRKSNMYKNNTKIKNIEEYKNFTHYSLCKKIGPPPNSCPITVILLQI